MSVEIQWNDQDPETGQKRFVRVSKFARIWQFQVRFQRRENWMTPPVITRDMWETLLDALERRYQRREGVSEEDVATVKKELAKKPKPKFDVEQIQPKPSEG